MRLAFIYQPVSDLAAAAAYYASELGCVESWREGDDAIGLDTPGRETQLMLSTTDQPAGPMYEVDDLAAWMRDHPAVSPTIEPYAIPGGRVAGFVAAGGNAFYVFDLADARRS